MGVCTGDTVAEYLVRAAQMQHRLLRCTISPRVSRYRMQQLTSQLADNLKAHKAAVKARKEELRALKAAKAK